MSLGKVRIRDVSCVITGPGIPAAIHTPGETCLGQGRAIPLIHLHLGTENILAQRFEIFMGHPSDVG